MELLNSTGGIRNIDTTKSSMDLVQLNNLVVSMRSTVKRCKVHIIRKLVQQIRKLQAKKGSDADLAANKRKIERLVKEIEILKQLHVDRISKHCLANTTPLSELGKQNDPESRVLLRIACHKVMTERVEAWREKHDDWKALAAFLLYKNTGRRFKKKKTTSLKKTKEDLNKVQTDDEENRLKEGDTEELFHELNKKKKRNKVKDHQQLHDVKESKNKVNSAQGQNESWKLSQITKCDSDSGSICSEHSDSLDEDKMKNPKKTQIIRPSLKSSSSEKMSSESDFDDGENETHSSEDDKPDVSRDSEAVVKKFSLDELGDGAEELDFVFRKPSCVETDSEESSPDKRNSITNMKKRDAFFCDSDSASPSEKSEGTDTEQSDGEDLSEVSDDEDICTSKRIPQESTFIQTLAGNPKSQHHTRGLNRFRSQGNKRGSGHGSSGNRGKKPFSQGRGRFERTMGFQQDRRDLKRENGGFKKGERGFKHQKDGFKNERGAFRQERDGSKKITVDRKQNEQVKKRSASENVESLHPSWAASKKRKQQQSLIGAFQGKKITFDD